MLSFGRLSKQNRLQQAPPPEQLSTGATSGGDNGGGGASVGAAVPGLDSVASADSSAETLPQSALSSTTAAVYPSDQFEALVDARPPPQGQYQLLQQQQRLHQHQQQQQEQRNSSPLPPHLFNQLGDGVHLPPSLKTPDPGRPPSFDGQQPQTPTDLSNPALSHSQSQRYGVPFTPLQHQQQQQVYGIASGSSDDLPSIAAYYQQQQPLQQQSAPAPAPAPAPQKRSTRKLIKGIFSSSRDSHDNQQQQQQQQQSLTQPTGRNPTGPYDNTAGLARRPSKRVSNPPNLKTSSSLAAPVPFDRDWHSHSTYSLQPSPLHEMGEIEECSFYTHGSNIDSPIQDSRIYSNSNSGRQNSGEREHLDTSSYDEFYVTPDHPFSQPPLQQQSQSQPQPQPQPQSLQRQSTIRIQEQQTQFESQNQQKQQQATSYDQQASKKPQQYFHHPGSSPQGPYPTGGEHRVVTSQQLHNAETISQLSHDSPVTDSDPRSTYSQQKLQQALGSNHGSTSSQDISSNLSTGQGTSRQGQEQTEMAPPVPGGGSQISRRTQDAEKGLRGQVDSSPGPLPGHHGQGSISINTMSPGPLPSQGVDPGRNSPRPSDRDSELEKQYKDLFTKYKHVKKLYFDGKSHIDQLNGQVEHLQNAVAHQRMSQSRTAWDDSEYLTRFNRLNGAINNLSFNIRKDWRSLPQWVSSFVSVDALKTGKQEMTAVGRAIVSKWLVDELFNKCFHPALDALLSIQLKEIELSIRNNSQMMHSQEEFDALTTKVVNWRMATLDGLQQKIASYQAAENRVMLTNKITTNLTAFLYQFLSTPPPPDVEGSASIIAELAVAIAANLPLESRDVAITYPLPGDTVQPTIMEVEKTGLPSLGAHNAAEADCDSDNDSGEKDKIGSSKDANRVRLAGFVALEVRGRQVLAKAPVWTL